MKKISIALELDSKPTKTRGNLHNVLIRVTKDRVSKRYATEFYINPKHWDRKDKRVIGGRRGDLQAAHINDTLGTKLDKTRIWLSEQRREDYDLSLADVIQYMNGEYRKVPQGDQHFFFRFADIILEQKKLSHYDGYMNAVSRVKNFRKYCRLKGIEDPVLSQIDVPLLRGFQSHLKLIGRKPLTINQNVSFIKGILKTALDYHEDEIQTDVFAKVKKLPKEGSKPKDKLTSEEIEALESIELGNAGQFHARNIFLFCYYVVGSRIRDALFMRYANYKEGITYSMRKNNKLVVVESHAKLEKILQPYLEYAHVDEDFIFPYLIREDFDGLAKKEQTNRIHSAVSTVNYHLKKIVKALGIKKNVSTHIARHSFAVNYFEETGDLKSTSDLLNHGDYSTTDRYLRQHGIMNKASKAKDFYDKS